MIVELAWITKILRGTYVLHVAVTSIHFLFLLANLCTSIRPSSFGVGGAGAVRELVRVYIQYCNHHYERSALSCRIQKTNHFGGLGRAEKAEVD